MPLGMCVEKLFLLQVIFLLLGGVVREALCVLENYCAFYSQISSSKVKKMSVFMIKMF